MTHNTYYAHNRDIILAKAKARYQTRRINHAIYRILLNVCVKKVPVRPETVNKYRGHMNPDMYETLINVNGALNHT